MRTLATTISAAVSLAIAGLAGNACAGGIAIGTQSGSGTGNAFAGGAAAAEDASTVWYNPAGMAILPKGRNLAVAAHALRPSFKFGNTGSTGAFAAPGTGEGGDGGDWALVPQAFFSTGLGEKWQVGLAFNVPFGLKTEYDAGWRGQLVALKSEVKTYNLNAAVAYRISDRVSVGGGVSWQRLEADLTNFAGAAGTATLKASDDGTGFNLGALFQASPGTRVGVAYRSSIGYKLSGTASFSGLPAGNSGAVADLTVPESVSISVFSSVSPRWDVMGDVTGTRWSRFKQLTVIRTTASALGAAGSTVTILRFNWRDTWRFSAGANYRMSEKWKLRFGVAHDQTPTNDTDRTPRLPDQDRTWVAFGAQYRMSRAATLDFGYAHEFIKDASVNNTATGAPGRLVGKFRNEANILSVQYSRAF